MAVSGFRVEKAICEIASSSNSSSRLKSSSSSSSLGTTRSIRRNRKAQQVFNLNYLYPRERHNSSLKKSTLKNIAHCLFVCNDNGNGNARVRNSFVYTNLHARRSNMRTSKVPLQQVTYLCIILSHQ